MPENPNPSDPRNLWQSQEVETVTITIDEVRHRARRLERRVYWRNAREYGAGVLVMAFFAPRLWQDHGWLLLRTVLNLAGVACVLYQLYRRRARPVPADAGMKDSLQHYRTELERQRDALRSIWRWYLGPMMPGLVATMLVMAVNVDRVMFVRTAVLGVVIVVGTWRLNEWGARKLDRRIQEVKAMEVTGE